MRFIQYHTTLQVPRGIVEVWRGGYMRTILALLLHGREIVRKSAAEVRYYYVFLVLLDVHVCAWAFSRFSAT